METGYSINGLEIRPPREDEFDQIVAIADLGFGEETPREDLEKVSASFPFDRSLCAYDGGRVVGTLGTYSLELTLPGHTALPAGGVTWGGTLPTHRRRGILSALIAGLTQDMVDRGEPLSVLMASEASIYPRFGYGPATSMMSFSVERAHAGLTKASAAGLSDRAAPNGITLLTDPAATEVLPTLYGSMLLDQPGAVTRSAGWWEQYLWDPPRYRLGGTRLYHAVHTGPEDTPDGYVTYRLRESWAVATPQYEVQVVELIAATPRAYRDLWEYILGTDLARTISCNRGRADEPLRRLLADSRRLTVNAVVDDLFVRILDIPRALAARHYAADGELVLELSEAFPVPRTSCYRLVVGAGGVEAVCTPTDRPADICLGVGSLATAYLGGTSFTELAWAGQATAARETALSTADAMFSWGVAPYCCTMF
jgi:predicted acetyltransferase